MTTIQNLLWSARERLPSFVFYERPPQYPDHYVAVLFWTLPEARPTSFTVRATNVDDLRDLMESCGLVKLDRSPEDDPLIMETWL